MICSANETWFADGCQTLVVLVATKPDIKPVPSFAPRGRFSSLSLGHYRRYSCQEAR